MNRNLQDLRLSGIRRFTALAQARGDCVLLTLGEPEFDTPAPIRNACKAALDQGLTHYTENQGDLRLREAVAAFERDRRGLRYTADQILITAGATEAVYTALTGILNPGDQVVIPVPAFGLYETVTRLAGAVPVPVDTAPYGFQLPRETLEAALSPRTKVLVLNSPHNPTGAVYTPETLVGIYEAVKGRPIFILCDDVYWGLSPCPGFAQYQDLQDRLLAVQSFSKPYAMTGWRVGYLMAEGALMQKLTALHGHVLTCAPAMLQAACLAALDCDTGDMAQAYGVRRAYLSARLEEMGLPFVPPAGAFYAFPCIAGYGLDSETFCTRMIQEAGVAAVPGACFGAEGYIRLSCCCGMEELARGLDRMQAFLKSLQPPG